MTTTLFLNAASIRSIWKQAIFAVYHVIHVIINGIHVIIGGST